MIDSEGTGPGPEGAALGETPEVETVEERADDTLNDQVARALVAVRGMDTDDARRRVHTALAAVPGVRSVNSGDGSKMVVDYDPSEATVMDLIRALRRIGFLAGMD